VTNERRYGRSRLTFNFANSDSPYDPSGWRIEGAISDLSVRFVSIDFVDKDIEMRKKPATG
jgi:hypothetical protein